jgi:hypothetical protein
MKKRANETTQEFVARRAELQFYRSQIESTNPKKSRSARRARNPIPGKNGRYTVYMGMHILKPWNESKYNPTSIITKRAR